MLRTRYSREFWLLAVVAVLVLGAGLGLRDPWPADEPRFALVARQMVESGNWLFPMRGDELYPDKPPLFMWLQAVCYLIVGNWRVAFLLPSLLAALGTLWCVVDLGKRLWTRRIGLYAGWAVLLALQFTWQAKKAQIDPVVVFWITLANYGLLRHVLRGPDWRMWMLGWAAAGLGTITKGVGVIALLMLIPAGIASLRGWPVKVHVRRARQPLTKSAAAQTMDGLPIARTRDASASGPVPDARGPDMPKDGHVWTSGMFWLGPLAFVLACGVWLVPMLIAALGNGPEYQAYVQNILFKQTATRYAASWHHQQPVWYFGEVMLTMWLPAMLALPWALPAWWRRLRRRDPRYLLPLAWWALVLVFFTIPAGKRDMYILPALPMAALALAPLLPGIVRKLWARRLALGFAALLTAAFLGLGLAMWFGTPGFEQRLVERRGLDDGGMAIAGFLLAVGAWGLAALIWFGRRRAIAAMVAVLVGVWVLFGLVGAPLLNGSSSSRDLMTEVGHRIGPDAQLGLVAWREQNLLMADRPAQTFGFKVPFDEQMRRGIAWQAQSPGSRWLLVQDAALAGCIDKARAQPLDNANRRGWWLVPGHASAGCR